MIMKSSRYAGLGVLAVMLPAAAVAQTAPVVVQAAGTVDLTGIATSVIAGIFGILGMVVTYLINNRVKDSQARDTLNAAVKNSLGAIQQAATLAVNVTKPAIALPGVAAQLAPGVQYVLDHAGDEAKRFNLSTTAIADKIDAQIGLAKIAASGSAPAVPAPIQPPPPIQPVVPPAPPAAAVPAVPQVVATTGDAPLPAVSPATLPPITITPSAIQGVPKP